MFNLNQIKTFKSRHVTVQFDYEDVMIFGLALQAEMETIKTYLKSCDPDCRCERCDDARERYGACRRKSKAMRELVAATWPELHAAAMARIKRDLEQEPPEVRRMKEAAATLLSGVLGRPLTVDDINAVHVRELDEEQVVLAGAPVAGHG